MPKKVNRQDVALAAGVSGATVSRVYNNPSVVDKATVARVRATAAALGFVPDRNAAALRRRSSGTLLFVEIDDGPDYRWPSQRAYQSLYGEIVRAVMHSIQGSSLNLQLVSLASAADIPTLERYGDFAGILGFDVTDEAVARALAALGRPVVCAHHGDHLTGVSTVSTDNRAGGALQARHLKEQGHQSVAYVTGLRDEVRSHRLRWEGFSRSLEPVLVYENNLGFAEGQKVGRQLAGPLRDGTVTAFACVNDLTALGVLQGLTAEGITLGSGVAVGYDNLMLTGLIAPGLATIEARLPQVYTRSLELLAALAAGTTKETHEVVAPVLESVSPSREKSGP